MHLLVDARTSSMSDIAHIRYAELWASLWQKNSPHDRITFLIYDGDRVESQDVISLPRGYLWQKKIAHHGHGPSRVISFSRLPPLDMSIPTITHVPDMVDVFYPRYTQNYIRRRYDGYTFRKNLKLSRYLIVPHRGIERDIVDMYGISEEKISIIPSLIEVQ